LTTERFAAERLDELKNIFRDGVNSTSFSHPIGLMYKNTQQQRLWSSTLLNNPPNTAAFIFIGDGTTHASDLSNNHFSIFVSNIEATNPELIDANSDKNSSFNCLNKSATEIEAETEKRRLLSEEHSRSRAQRLAKIDAQINATMQGNEAMDAITIRGSAHTINTSVKVNSAYIDNQDGTVTDTRTGLTWMRCALGQTWSGTSCLGTATPSTWKSANTTTIKFSGHSEWRLPTISAPQYVVP
jgi:hypothetical protein